MIRKCYSIQKSVIEVYKNNAFVGYYSGKSPQGGIFYGDLQNAELNTENHNNRVCEYLNSNHGGELCFWPKRIMEHHTDLYYHENEDFNRDDIRVLWVICVKEHPDSKSVFIMNINSSKLVVKEETEEILHGFITTTEIDKAHAFKEKKRVETICKNLSRKCNNQYVFYPERFYVRKVKELELIDC